MKNRVEKIISMLTLNFDHLEKSSSRSFCKTFSFKNKERPNLGTLFLILEIKLNPKDAQKISEIVSEIINLEYFKKIDEIEKNFEFALSRANQAMSTLAETGHLEWLNKLHAIVCVICNGQIQLATAGKSSAMLLRGNEIINIVEGLTSAASSPNPMKTFANIISGTLKPNDKLFLATPSVLDYFSKDKITRIIKKSSAKAARQVFSIDVAEEFEPMAMLIIEIEDKAQQKQPSFYTQKPIETKTFQKPTFSLPQIEKIETSQNIPAANKTGQFKSFNLNKIKETINKNLKNTYRAAISLFQKIKPKFPPKTQKDLTTPQVETKASFKLPRTDSNAVFIKINNYFKKIFSLISLKFKQLTPLSRTLLFVALIFILAFIVSVSRGTSRKKTKETTNKYENALSEAKTKEKNASDALIYNDLKKAQTLLIEAKQTVEKDVLPSKKHQSEGQNLLSKIQEDLDKTDKVIRINPQTLLDLETNKLNFNNILGIEKNLYAFDSKNTSIYKFNEAKKYFSLLGQNKENLGKVVLATINDTKEKILLLTNKPDLFEFNLNSKDFSDLDVAFGASALPKDMKLYMDRLYVLSPEANQIFRHVRTITGYSKGVEWFEDNKNINIKDAVSFAIDGSVYILKSNGQILKFLNTEKEEFGTPQMLVSMSLATKIFTLPDYEFVYILEPSQKRIIVLDKKGVLKNQYLSNEFSDAKDIYVNEKDKKIYVLTAKKLFEVLLEK